MPPKLVENNQLELLCQVLERLIGAQFSKLFNKVLHQSSHLSQRVPWILDCKWYGTVNLRMFASQWLSLCEELMVENQIMFIDRKVARYRTVACRALRTSGGEKQTWLLPTKLIEDLEFRP